MPYGLSLAALADPTRRKVFEALATQPLPVGELACQFPVSRPAISQHLKVLSEAGLVEARKSGRQNVYQARQAGLADLRAYLDAIWGDVLASFSQAVEKDNDNA